MATTVSISLDRYNPYLGIFETKEGEHMTTVSPAMLGWEPMSPRLLHQARPRETTAPATAGELLDLVRTGRAHTRSELQRVTGLSRTAVTSRVSALTAAGLLLAGEER